VAQGADIIDINMGCPAKKVCKAWAGSALMRDERWSPTYSRPWWAAVDVPVTLKIRTGWDHDQRNAPVDCPHGRRCRHAALTIHGRTRDQKYTGQAEYDTIARIKSASWHSGTGQRRHRFARKAAASYSITPAPTAC
jgi:tRNA-dihydrouridine synthase B